MQVAAWNPGGRTISVVGKVPTMIRLTRLNHVPLMINSDLIEHLEMTPDTVITLTTGQKIMVLESAEEVLERVIEIAKAGEIEFSAIVENFLADYDRIRILGDGFRGIDHGFTLCR